jgi:hypothetical protein
MRRALLAVALAGIVAGCGPFWDGVGDSSDEITDAVDAAGASGKAFRLANVTDFEWDRFYAFGGYTTPRQIDRTLGFHWGDAEHSDFVKSDGGSLLVFVRDGEVVEAFDQNWADGHFDCLHRREFTPEDATLRVSRVSEGGETFDYVLPVDSVMRRHCRSFP